MYELPQISAALISVVTLVVGGLFGARRSGSASTDDEKDNLRLRARVRELEAERRQLDKLCESALQCVERLHSVRSLRDIPGITLDYLKELFEPAEALVLIRRRPAVAESDRERQLIAAAAIGTQVRKGTVLDLESGPLSLAATHGKLSAHSAPPGSTTELQGFRPDFAVPMTIDQETIGVLTASGSRQRPFLAIRLLQFVARAAAQTYRNSTTLNRVRSEADLDALTGVLNKGALTQLLSEFSEDAKKYGRPLSLFLFDIDHFKNYNDTNGHLAGDDCLRLVSRLVQDRVRADDAFGRWGGEEFLLLLPGRDPGEARFVAEEILRRIADFPFPHSEKQPLGFVSVSGGVACLPDHGLDPDGVIEAADRALYAAKRAGRNRLEVARQEVTAAVEKELRDLPLKEDSLQLINGIGPKFSERLEAMGVFSFQQIAELDWRGMVRLADALGTTPERIVRERWLAQARDLQSADQEHC